MNCICSVERVMGYGIRKSCSYFNEEVSHAAQILAPWESMGYAEGVPRYIPRIAIQRFRVIPRHHTSPIHP